MTNNSPYANCTVGGPGTNFLNAEVEPWIDVNPTTIGTSKVNLVGAWQQDRWSNGGSHGLVAGYSFDGGKSWGETTLPFTTCAAGGLNYERASDPWVSFGPDGTAYTISISFNQSNNDNAVAAATSIDGGQHWSNVRTLITDTGNQFFNDKESITADPTHSKVAYAVWDRLLSPGAGGDAQAYIRSHSYQGPTYFARTSDGGQSWEPAKVIYDPGQSNQTIGNQIVVDPHSGTLYNFFDLIVSTGSNSNKTRGYNVAFIKSNDGGTTWTAPQTIASLQSVGVTDPNTGATIRTGDIIPEPAIDPASGNLYIVWQDSRFNGGHYDEIASSSSSDKGATWTAPKQVNTPSGRPAFTAVVHVNSAGTVGVAYYDFRYLTNQTKTLPTDYWFTSSSNGGATFGNEKHLAGSFDMLTAPNSSGYFVGDYEGLTSIGTNFQSFFIAANSGNTSNPTDVLTEAVTP